MTENKGKDQKNWFQKHPVWTVVIGLFLLSSFAFGGKNKNEVPIDSSVENNQVIKTIAENNITQPENTEAEKVEVVATLPIIDQLDYIGEEGLIVFNELKNKGYEVEIIYKEADTISEKHFEAMNKQAQTITTLDMNNSEERLSVDAMTIDNVEQIGDKLKLIIVTVPRDENGNIFKNGTDCRNYSPELTKIVCE